MLIRVVTPEQKEKRRAATKRYRQAHLQEIRARDLARYYANKDECNARNKAYREAHTEELLAKGRERDKADYKTNPEAQKLHSKQWREKNRERHRASSKAYRDANPEWQRCSSNKKRARKRGAVVNDLTAAQWAAIKEHYKHCCVYCGKQQERLTQDHLTPLSKGGNHTVSNVVPACRSCNSKKHAGPVLVPVQPLLFV